MVRRARCLGVVYAAVLGAACGLKSKEAPDDARAPDARPADAATVDATRDAGDRGGPDTGVPDAGDCVPGQTRDCTRALPDGACRVMGTQTCLSAGYGPCEYVYGSDFCGNQIDDDRDGQIDEDRCDCDTNDEEWCNRRDDNCDGAIDEGCLDCREGRCVSFGVSAADMCRGAGDPTGAGECVGPMYCASPDGAASTTPPGGCGVPHCGTLRSADGREHARYCTIRGTCVGGVPTPTGFGW